MKKLLAGITTILLLGTAKAQMPGTLPQGAAIPMADVKLKSVDGKETTIKDAMQQNGVLVMFSCNTCPYVVKYQKRTQQMIKEAAKRKIGIIILNSNEEYRTEADSYEAMQTYAKKQQYTVPYVVDTKSAVADAFGATRTPECFLFNAAGKLVYHGAIDDSQDIGQVTRQHLLIALDELIAGKPITMNESRSIGCMIKRLD